VLFRSPAPEPRKSRARPPTHTAYRADQRFKPARRQKAVVADLCREIGVPLADLPLSRRAMVADAAALIVRSEELQAEQARGEAVDADSLVRMSNALSRSLDALGLSAEGLERRKQAEAEAERKRLLDQYHPNRTWDR